MYNDDALFKALSIGFEWIIKIGIGAFILYLAFKAIVCILHFIEEFWPVILMVISATIIALPLRLFLFVKICKFSPALSTVLSIPPAIVIVFIGVKIIGKMASSRRKPPEPSGCDNQCGSCSVRPTCPDRP